jgi:hypothetical protein
MKRALLPMVFLCSCATLASEGHGDVDLPNLLSGPFRVLKNNQTCNGDVCVGVDELPHGTSTGIPSYPGTPPSKSPAVLVRGTLHVILYAARGTDIGKPDRIVRMESTDARTFTDVSDVLSAEAGETLSDPWAVEVGSEVWLYYGVPGGIGRARSTDGLAGRVFQKEPKLAIGGTVEGWETDPPRAPSVAKLDDGTFHLFYGSGNAIGEATSSDGVTFTRVAGPVIAPSPPKPEEQLGPGERPPFDDLSVDDPCIDRSYTPLGRVLWRVLYTGRDRRGGSSVGYAGRFGDVGTFERKVGFVFGGKLPGTAATNSHANAPAVARFDDFALVFANIDVDKGQKIGIGVAPQTRLLPLED